MSIGNNDNLLIIVEFSFIIRRMATERFISWNEGKLLIAIGTIIVSITLSWASLTNQINLLAQKQDITIQDTAMLKADVNELKKEQANTKNELVRLQTIINSAQQKGLLSRKTTTPVAIPLTSTITLLAKVEPAREVVTPAASPTAPIAPTATPIPPTPTPEICVLVLCFGKIGL